MQLAREVCLVLLDRGHYTGQVIKQLLQDPDCGPLCYAAVAALLKKAGHPASSAVAQRGLGRLSAELFDRDVSILLRGTSGDWLREMIAAVASLTHAERDAVAAHLTPPRFGQLFLQAHAIGRRAADENLPPHEAAYRVSHASLQDWLEAETVRSKPRG